MEFRTILSNDTNLFTTNPGKPYLEEYEYTLDKTGKRQLVKKDTVDNVYERIQAERDSCDINKLMERFALGDTEALNVQKGWYADVRDMPKTYLEVQKLGIAGEQYFASLPVEVKQLFDNSHDVFFTEYGSETFENKINSYNERFVNHDFDVDLEEIEHNE